MKVKTIIKPKQILQEISEADKAIGLSVLNQSFAVRNDESLVIVTDDNKLFEASIFFEAAKDLVGDVSVFVIEDMTENAQEPPEEVAQAMLKANIGLLVTTLSLTHTRASGQAVKSGTRVASMPGIDKSMFGVLQVDYDSLVKNSSDLAKALSEGETIEITSPGGTNLKASLKGRQAISDDGQFAMSGSFGNLPAGEAFIAPVEDSVQGKLVIDGSLADIDLDSPVTIDIEAGRAVKISGKKAAKTLEKFMDQVGPEARVVCEIGLGTNPKAKAKAHIIESEKAFGTCHVAFGDNMGFGGQNEANFHTDGLILKPTVKVDGKTIIKDGQITVS